MVLSRRAIGIPSLRPSSLRVSALLFLSLLLVAPAIATAQGRADAERLTHDLVVLGARHARADAASREAIARELADVALERQALIDSLIETDPGTVLSLTLTNSDRATLPASVLPLVEQETVTDGTLDVFYEDYHDGSALKFFLNTATERLALHSASKFPRLTTNTRVRVRGVKTNGAMALSGSTSIETLAISTSNTFGPQKTLVILVNFQNNPGNFPYTITTAENVVFNQSNAWDKENSFQQTSLTGDVYGWFTIALDNTGCDYNTIAALAKQAATNAGVNVAAYQRYVYAFPGNGCSWWGLGSVGGSPSQAWINGSLALKVVAHEMGHNFGLYHSNAWDCGATVVDGTCSSIEYGDPIDMMGQASSGHFNAFQKERLGWLNYGASPPITNVTSSGTYTIEPYASAGTGPKALKILKTASPPTWYYVEYRRATGADSFLSSNTNMQNGVVLHTGSSSTGNSSYMLDATPGTSSFSDGAVTVGNTFTDASANVTITPLSVGSSGAVVSVSVGSAPQCTRQSPTVTLGPAGASVPRGTPVTYSASVTNLDSAACGTSVFNLQATWPGGWTASLNSSLAIAPAASATATLTVTSSSTATAGSYAVGMTAVNGSATAYAGSASSTYTVAGATCSYSVSPTSQSMASGAATGSIAVTSGSGCAWTATSNSSWITVTSGSSGSANGSVGYSALQNTTAASRSGTLTVASQTVTVTQAAAPTTPPGGTGGTTIADDFNRPDSTVLGNGWSVVAGNLVIASNELRNVLSSTSPMVTALQAGAIGATQTVSASFAAPDLNAAPQFGFVLRYQDPLNYYYVYRTTGGSSQLRISRIKNGVETILASKGLSNPQKNVFFVLTAKVSGSTLTLDANGASTVTATDTAFSSGSVGVSFGGKNQTYHVDNFTASLQ